MLAALDQARFAVKASHDHQRHHADNDDGSLRRSRAAKGRFVVVPANARISSSPVIVTPSAEGATHLQDGSNAG
jgi:hypothetical protein